MKFKNMLAWAIIPFAAFQLGCATIKSSEPIDKQPKKEWKVSAYLDGDSEIDSPTFWSFNKLEKAGSNERVDIYAQLDRWESDKGPDEGLVIEYLCIDSKFGTKRFHVLKDDDMLKIKSKEIGSDKELNMGAYKNFKDFVEWVEKYDSKRHMLIIKDHGCGIMKPLRQIVNKYFEGSDQEDSMLPIYSIYKVFDKNLKDKLEVIVFDSCEKATIEIAYQLRNHAKVMVASEAPTTAKVSFEGGGIKLHLSGIAYDKVLEYITQNQDIDAKELGKFIIDSYFEIFDNNPRIAEISTTFSAINLKNLANFVEKFSKFSNTLVKRMEDEKTRSETIKTLKKALKETQCYGPSDNLELYTHVDLFDFLKNISRYSNDKKLKKDLKILNKLDIIIESRYKGNEVKKSNGISILFIESFGDMAGDYCGGESDKKCDEHMKDYYSKSDFAKKTRWGKVQELYQEYSKDIASN